MFWGGSNTVSSAPVSLQRQTGQIKERLKRRMICLGFFLSFVHVHVLVFPSHAAPCSGRPTAIFGVYNALRETETPVHGCSFGGIWPSLRGVQVQSSVGSSGLSRDFPMLATAISAEIDVALSFLYASGGMAGGRNQGRARRRSTLLGSAKEAKVAALEETESRRLVLHCLHKRPQGAALCKVIWTYSSLVGEGADPVADLQQAMVFAEEIDVHFSLPNGTIRALFETFANVTGCLTTHQIPIHSRTPKQPLQHCCWLELLSSTVG